jgi:hypothetical protein
MRNFWGTPVIASLVAGVSAFSLSVSALGQTSSAPQEDVAAPSESPSPWAFSFTPYAWLTWMSGSQTVRGRSVDIDNNVFQLLDNSDTLVPFMGYFQARFENRIELFADVMYAGIGAGQSATRNFQVNPFVGGSVTASASQHYEQLTVELGGAYQVAKFGRDRSVEGPGMSGVGQTALDVLLGGRYWYQKVDLTLNIAGTIGVNVGDLQLSADRSKAFAKSGSVSWVDPFVGLRIRHRLAPQQDLQAQADIGGFGVGSQISWQALTTYSYQFGSTGSVAWAGVIGYRALYVDYVQGSGNTLFQTNLLQHGPLIGLSARF